VSHLDVIFVSQKACGDVTQWMIFDEETLNLHKYIVFTLESTNDRNHTIHGKRTQNQHATQHGWCAHKLDRSKLEEALRRVLPTSTVHVGKTSVPTRRKGKGTAKRNARLSEKLSGARERNSH